MTFSKDFYFLLFFITLKFVLQFVLVHPGYDLHRDEYLHLDQARHLAWGYESVPPFTSWISYLIISVGSPMWLIRFFPALCGGLTMLVVWKTTAALNGGLFAKVLGAMAILFSAILRVNILYQPNSFDILSWTCLYASVVAFLIYRKPNWLYVAAIVFAFGFLNKYNIAFLMTGLIPAMFIAGHRSLFLNKHLYGAAALSLLLIAPNLFWQYQHGFPVIKHMQALKETQLVNVNRLDFLKEQVLFFISSFYIVLAALFSFFLHRHFKTFKFLAYSFIITLIVFLFLKAKSYYAIGLYPIYIAFGAVYLEHLLKHKPAYYVRFALVCIKLLLAYPLLKIAFPVYAPSETKQKANMYREFGMLRWEDGKEHTLPQDFADMLGWKELALKVDAAQAALGDDASTIILCDNYGQAGAINFYTKNKPKAVSFNADYKNWFDLGRTYKHMIRVKESDDDLAGIVTRQNDFESIKIAGSILDTLAREAGTTIYIFKNARINLNDTLKKHILEGRPY